MKVAIDLPGASVEDACAFGLWLDMILRSAREDGDMDTVIGEIQVEQ